jgi:hypothetical protein
MKKDKKRLDEGAVDPVQTPGSGREYLQINARAWERAYARVRALYGARHVLYAKCGKELSLG